MILPPSHRASARPRRSRLSLETLEDRLALSTLSHEAWAQTVFSLGEVHALQPDGTVRTGQIDLVNPGGTGDPSIASSEARSLIGANQVESTFGYRGTGYSVAVLDTGIDYNHANLGGGWGNRVVAGYDFVNNDTNPMDDHGHGTHVAGIIGSNHASYRGIAPEVNLIALKVLNSAGSGTYGDVERALQWVIANRTTYNIVAINLSLGSGNYTVNPANYIDDEFSTLKSQSVFISVASGNSFYSYSSQPGVAFPSISPHVVSVGAVWASNFGPASWSSGAQDTATAADRITSFTQRGTPLDILAPGAFLTNTYVGGGFASLAGTSMAAPVVAGAAAVLRQALDSTGQSGLVSQDYLLGLMQSTGVTITDGDDEQDNVTNTGLSFQRLNFLAAVTQVQANANAAPVVAPLVDRSMSPAQNSITVTVSASDADGDTLTYSAAVRSAGSQAYTLDQSLGLYYPGNYYLNTRGANEKYLQGTGGLWYFLLPDGRFYRYTTSIAASTLLATLDSSYYADPSLLYNAQPVAAPAVTLTFAGNQLTVDPPAGFTGSFLVDVSVSDGVATTVQSFTVTVTNTAPTLTPIADQTVSAPAPLTLTIGAADADGDTLTYSAAVRSAGSQAYSLDQSLGLYYPGNYYLNIRGANEKYLQGTGGLWYFLLPDGRFYQYTTSIAASTLLATLDPSYYADPSLLYNAQAPAAAPSVAFSFNGNQMTVDPPDDFIGSFIVDLTVSDGTVTLNDSFTVTVVGVVNNAPTLAAIADQTMAGNQASLTLTLSAADPDGDTLTYSAAVRSAGSQAYTLDQSLGLYYPGSYYFNVRGANEKYLQGTGGLWYFLLPDGKFYQYTTSIAASTLLATLDSSYYADPSLLYNAQAPAAAPSVAFSFNGNQMTVDPPAGYTGSFLIDVTASDGAASATRTFTFTVTPATNTAPTLAVIADQAMSSAQNAITLTLNAADADGNTLSYSAAVRAAGSQAHSLDQSLGLYHPGNDYLNARGANEKYLQGTGGLWYFLLPDGRFYQYTTSIAASTLLATLDSSYYTTTSLLYNAQAPAAAPSVGLSFNGNQITIDPPAGYTGSFLVDVTVSDGTASATRSFTVTVTAPANNAPTLAVIADQTMPTAQNTLVLTLSAADADGDVLSYSATVQAAGSQAYDLDQSLGLYHPGSDYFNVRGLNEKYLQGSGGQWYYILPDGKFYRWGGSIAASTLVATLDPSYHANTALLYNAQPAVAPAVSVSFSGNQLTIDPPAGYTGSFLVEVAVSDALSTVRRTFRVTVT